MFDKRGTGVAVLRLEKSAFNGHGRIPMKGTLA